MEATSATLWRFWNWDGVIKCLDTKKLQVLYETETVDRSCRCVEPIIGSILKQYEEKAPSEIHHLDACGRELSMVPHQCLAVLLDDSQEAVHRIVTIPTQEVLTLLEPSVDVTLSVILTDYYTVKFTPY